MMEVQVFHIQLRILGRLSLAIVMLLGVLSIAQLWQGYRKLEVALALHRSDADYGSRLHDSLAGAYEYPLLRPYAELFMSGTIDISADTLSDKLEQNQRIMRFVPIASAVYRQVRLLALDGRLPEAETQLQQALWSYPAEFQGELSELHKLAANDPAHFSALLEFAILKNEEYQRAVSGK
jgi:hypothetical protein